MRGLDQLEELHRPWIDEVVITCEQCGEEVRRIPEVGDVWLDAGIVPFSTLGWQSPERARRLRDRRRRGALTNADLPDHAYWEQWFPADWVTEMREQIRLWFYSQLFMSVVLVGRAPFRSVLGYEKMLDEHGREMHGSWGNMIEAEEAFERMGADVMRWQYCEQPPDRNLLFGYGPAHEIKRRLLTLLELGQFFVDYAEHRGLPAELRRPERGPLRARRSTAGSSRARDSSSPRRREAYEDAHASACRRLRVVRRRPVQLVHPPLAPRFYAYDEAALRHALALARPVSARDRAGGAVPGRAPVAEPRPRRVRGRARVGASSPAWPEPRGPRRGAAGGDRGGAAHRRARPPGARRGRA